MSEITTIGLDIAKHVFQVHGIDAQGTTVLRKRLRRGQVLAFFSQTAQWLDPLRRQVMNEQAPIRTRSWLFTPATRQS